MPGKINPTQCEAIFMICIQVIAEDSAVAFAGSQGNFELNTMPPVIINNFLHAATILGDGAEKFRIFSAEGTELNLPRINELLDRSLMLVTALSPVMSYDNAAKIAHDRLQVGGVVEIVVSVLILAGNNDLTTPKRFYFLRFEL
jgi:fumarate hydratase class II